MTSGAIGDFQLFRAGEWLRGKGLAKEDPLPHLERAYAELMRETSFLAPEHRQRFLFQVPTHQAIVDAATRRGLGMPTGGRALSATRRSGRRGRRGRRR